MNELEKMGKALDTLYDKYTAIKENTVVADNKELVEIVRCKNCIHRPIKGEDIHDIDPPKDSRGYEDYTCPYLNEDDYWYSRYPSDEWFCAEGSEKGERRCAINLLSVQSVMAKASSLCLTVKLEPVKAVPV